MFSILVPVYNVEKYLAKCLESILNQTCQDLELILVDDGSKDSSGKICDEYADKNPNQIRVIHQENHGLLCARRVGIVNAKGDYCVFVDSDDFVEQNLLKAISNVITKTPNVDVVLYSFCYHRNGKPAERFHSIAEDGKIWRGEEKCELYEKLLFTNDVSPIWTKAVKTSLLQNDPTDYKPYYGKNMAEDVLQSLYILTAAKTIAFLDVPLYNYRILSDSISHTFTPQSLARKNCLHVYEKELEYLRLWGMDTAEYRAKVAANWFGRTMYEFICCYENAKSFRERKAVVDADWKLLIPNVNDAEMLKYVGKTYEYLYWQIKEKHYLSINLFFLKWKYYKHWKKTKKYFLSCN